MYYIIKYRFTAMCGLMTQCEKGKNRMSRQPEIKAFKPVVLEKLAEFIAASRTGSKITEFFYKSGFPNICHDGSTKYYFVYKALKHLHDGEDGSVYNIVRIIEQLADPQEYINEQEDYEGILLWLNEILSFYNHKVNNRGKVVPAYTTQRNTITEFFISCDKTDQDWAEWIAWQLEDVGHSTTLEAWDLRPGDNFILKMQDATEKAERTIMILSPDYLTSVYRQPEWAAAFRRDPTGEHGLLLPIHVHECKNMLRGLLAQIALIDLVGLDEASVHRELFNGIYHRRNKPTIVPRFPGGS
jgi:hypothetical protein